MVKVNGDGPLSSISNNDDCSFVVLERSTAENVSPSQDVLSSNHVMSCRLGESLVNQESSTIELPSDQLVLLQSTLALDLSPEEIERRLQDLIQENMKLKETLHQNNLAMKTQFNTLIMWQEDVIKVHQTHKEKFEETKNLIIKLMAENNELKKALNEQSIIQAKEYDAINQQLLEENATLKKKLIDAQEKINSILLKERQPSSKESELGMVVEQLTRQLEVSERCRRQLSIDNEKLDVQQQRLQAELENNKLPTEIGEEETQSSDIMDKEKLLDDLKKYEESVEKMSYSLEKQSERCTSMASWLQVADSSLQLETIELRKLLVEEQKQSVGTKEKLHDAENNMKQLLADYRTLVNQWYKFKERQVDKENHDKAYNEVQRKSLEEKVDSLTAQLVSQKESTAQELASMKEKVRCVELDNESIGILKAQVTIYQNDFNLERKSRETLAGEKERLAEDLRHLQQRNQELLDELLTYQKEHFESYQRTPTQTRTSKTQQGSNPSASKPGVEAELFRCPICSKAFQSVLPLERHVQDCLNIKA